MAWRVARSLDRLLAQINAAAPNRNKASDGSIGDAAHASRDSDHNPRVIDGSMGVVTARDFTHDPAGGFDCEALYQALVKSRDPRIKYVIWNRTITSGGRDFAPWQRRGYSGSNPHTKHLHLSVRPEKSLYDDARDWAMPGGSSAPAPSTGDWQTTDGVRWKWGQPVDARPGSRVIGLGSRGPNDVEAVQRWHGLTADGWFGPDTFRKVKETQKRNRLAVDGFVGPQTWKVLNIR